MCVGLKCNANRFEERVVAPVFKGKRGGSDELYSRAFREVKLVEHAIKI